MADFFSWELIKFSGAVIGKNVMKRHSENVKALCSELWTGDAASDIEKLKQELIEKIDCILPCLSLCSVACSQGKNEISENALQFCDEIFKRVEELLLGDEPTTFDKAQIVMHRFQDAIKQLQSVVPYLNLAISCSAITNEQSIIVSNIYAKATVEIEKSRNYIVPTNIGPTLKFSCMTPHQKDNGTIEWENKKKTFEVQVSMLPSKDSLDAQLVLENVLNEDDKISIDLSWLISLHYTNSNSFQGYEDTSSSIKPCLLVGYSPSFTFGEPLKIKNSQWLALIPSELWDDDVRFLEYVIRCCLIELHGNGSKHYDVSNDLLDLYFHQGDFAKQSFASSANVFRANHKKTLELQKIARQRRNESSSDENNSSSE